MKYFTPELLERIASPDDAVADTANLEWERAIVRSKQHWPRIQAAFPEDVRLFEQEAVCLHDAQVLSMGAEGETFVAVLQREPPAEKLVLLTFTLVEEPVIDPHAIEGHGDHDFVTWLYEEWDLDRRKRCCFEVLLSNGWSVRLRFRDFHFQILPRILPARNGQSAKRLSPMVSRAAAVSPG
jgi:hypothetical protein